MDSVCCGCRKETVNDNPRNIFNDELNVYDNNSVSSEHEEETKISRNIKLCTGIEIITGHKISKLDVKSANLCEKCFQKMESYINFRTELVKSLGVLISESSGSDIIDSKVELLSDHTGNTESNENLNRACGQLIPKESFETITSKDDYTNVEKVFQVVAEKDMVEMNVDANTLIQNFDIVSQAECDTTDLLDTNKLENEGNDQSYHSDSENSNNFPNMALPKHFMEKVQDTDIESEINICSSEDDEIVELDIQCRKYDMIQIDSSSESEVEVCDYEPTGKKMKYYNSSSPPILF